MYSSALCPTLSDCVCAPSVLQWKKHIQIVYCADDRDTLKRAYVDIVVAEYA